MGVLHLGRDRGAQRGHPGVKRYAPEEQELIGEFIESAFKGAIQPLESMDSPEAKLFHQTLIFIQLFLKERLLGNPSSPGDWLSAVLPERVRR